MNDLRPPRGFYWAVALPSRSSGGDYKLTLYKRRWLVWRKKIGSVSGTDMKKLFELAQTLVESVRNREEV